MTKEIMDLQIINDLNKIFAEKDLVGARDYVGNRLKNLSKCRDFVKDKRIDSQTKYQCRKNISALTAIYENFLVSKGYTINDAQGSSHLLLMDAGYSNPQIERMIPSMALESWFLRKEQENTDKKNYQ